MLFQSIISFIFFKLFNHGVVVYLNDIQMYRHTIDKHLELLQEVFALLQKYKLNIKESKYHLFIETAEFLGYIIYAKGVYIDQGEVDIIMK